MKHIVFILVAVFAVGMVGCTKTVEEKDSTSMNELPSIEERYASFAPVRIAPNISELTTRQQQLIHKLVEAGKLADEIFWMQTAPDAIALRDSLAGESSPEAKQLLAYVQLMYGPYDRVYDGQRFAGAGPETKPPMANFYPQDMTKEEFEKYCIEHPDFSPRYESQYTVIKRDENGNLDYVPYHMEYPQVARIAELLDEAAALADNPSLKKYLTLRAKAIRTDDYFESDMAWMELKDNDIDVVIGPIENYEDGLFNYKTAYECAVMVKDKEGTAELQKYLAHIDDFEHALPEPEQYRRETAGSGNVLEVVNIVYFGGDFQAGVKTIAASLPNDPRVHAAKGGKKQMYKNLMEAKFEKIVIPIADEILSPALRKHVDRKAFTNFVTLHEVSHTLGSSYVYGKKDVPVRKALKERYSAIEECKADVLGLYNNVVLEKVGLVDDAYIQQAIATYIAGLYRSLRFGAEEAHGKANLIQLNWLREKNAIQLKDGKFNIAERAEFMKALEGLAREVLTLQAEGGYARAGKLMDEYGEMTEEIRGVVARLAHIPRDLHTTYQF